MPEAAPLLPPLVALVACLFALAFLQSAHLFVAALFGVVNKATGLLEAVVPWLGGKVKAPIHRVEQRVNNFLLTIVTGTEAAVAESWHNLAHAVVFTGKAMVSIAQAAWRIAWYVEVKFPLKVISALVHQGVRGAKGLLKRVEHAAVRTQTIIKVIEHPQAGPIATGVRWGTRTLRADMAALQRWARVRLKAIEAELADVIHVDIPSLRDIARGAERRVARLWKLTKANERRWGALAFAGAVAFALARLGAGWTRCTNWNRLGRRVCGTDPGLIEDLLAGTLLIVGGISIIEFAKELQGIMGDAESGIRGFIRETR